MPRPKPVPDSSDPCTSSNPRLEEALTRPASQKTNTTSVFRPCHIRIKSDSSSSLFSLKSLCDICIQANDDDIEYLLTAFACMHVCAKTATACKTLHL